MKKATLFLVVLIAILCNSCEEVINVDLNTAPAKLVIEAAINWSKGTDGNEQKIKLTTTTDFYNSTIPKVSGATVFIKNSSNTQFDFIEKPKTGEYICDNFIPEINETYTLTIIREGQTYTAVEKMVSVAPITKIVQTNRGGFAGNTIEIKAFYNDEATEDNYFLYRYVYSTQIKSNYSVAEDKFFQGNEFFSISQNNELKAGDKLEISHFGISKLYFNYMNVLVNIAGNTNGSPFQSPPATVRGNIINLTNFDNFALGYFSVSEVDTKNYVVQ
jgi:hypothetical protein